MKIETKLFFVCGILYILFFIFAYFDFHRISMFFIRAAAVFSIIYFLYMLVFVSRKNKEVYKKWKNSNKN